jgi:hypothetical protein
MAANLLPLLPGGGAILLLKGKKKKKTSSIVFDDEQVTGGANVAPTPPSNGVTLSVELDAVAMGATWPYRTLDAWLNERRLSGRLAVVDHDAGQLYRFLVEDPSTWIGDITGLGDTGGKVIYGGLWLMATAGLGIYASGFASAGANIHAATQAVSATRAMQILGPRATQIAGEMYKKGFGASQIGLALMDFGGTTQMAKFGVSQGIVMMSGGVAGLGASMAAGLLAEAGIDAAFSPDLAASATEAAAEFTLEHTANVGGIDVPMALLPSGDEYPAVQELNKFIMGYILKFQQSTFED